MKNKFLATVFLTSFGICSLNAESIGMFEAYSMALNNSHEAKSLDYQLQADEELVSQAYSQILPQVTTQMAKINVKEKVNSKYSSVGQVEQDVTDKTINLSQVIFNADLFTRIDVEKSRVDIMKAEKGLQKQELAKKVFNGYLEILKSKNKIELNNSYLKYNEYNLLSMEKKHQMDLASKMDYLETKVEYNNARVELRKEEDLLKFSPEDVISYYPNPVREELYLKWELVNENKVSSIEVFTINGQRVNVYSNLEKENTKNIPFQEYPQGTYLVLLSYTNGDQKSITILKK
jgi:outer membrane protein